MPNSIEYRHTYSINIMSIHPSLNILPFTIISIYPSIEHKDKVAALVQFENGEQKVIYLNGL